MPFVNFNSPAYMGFCSKIVTIGTNPSNTPHTSHIFNTKYQNKIIDFYAMINFDKYHHNTANLQFFTSSYS